MEGSQSCHCSKVVAALKPVWAYVWVITTSFYFLFPCFSAPGCFHSRINEENATLRNGKNRKSSNSSSACIFAGGETMGKVYWTVLSSLYVRKPIKVHYGGYFIVQYRGWLVRNRKLVVNGKCTHIYRNRGWDALWCLQWSTMIPTKVERRPQISLCQFNREIATHTALAPNIFSNPLARVSIFHIATITVLLQANKHSNSCAKAAAHLGHSDASHCISYGSTVYASSIRLFSIVN